MKYIFQAESDLQALAKQHGNIVRETLATTYASSMRPINTILHHNLYTKNFAKMA